MQFCCVNVTFLARDSDIMVVEKKVLVLRGSLLKYLRVRSPDVCNFQIVREKSVCVCVEKERRVHTHR